MIFIKILIFLFVAILIQVQSQCPCQNGGVCFQQTSYCVCTQNYIGQKCQQFAKNITMQEVQAQINTNNFSYFYFEPQDTNYYQVKLDICIIKSAPEARNIIFLEFEDMNGVLQPNPKTNISGTQSCNSYYTQFLPYRKKFNNQMQRLIFGIKFSVNQKPSELTQRITIKCQGLAFLSETFWMTLIISFLCVIGILAIGSIVFVIRQRYLNRKREENLINNLSHFDKQMPKMKYKVFMEEKQIKQECAICLSQLQQSDQVRKTPCQHIFHYQCLDQWCKANITCPICRTSLEQQSISVLKLSKQTSNIRQPML